MEVDETRHVQWLDECVVIIEDAELCGYTTAGWYFWDETQAYCHGPFSTQEKAKAKLKEYAENL